MRKNYLILFFSGPDYKYATSSCCPDSIGIRTGSRRYVLCPLPSSPGWHSGMVDFLGPVFLRPSSPQPELYDELSRFRAQTDPSLSYILSSRFAKRVTKWFNFCFSDPALPSTWLRNFGFYYLVNLNRVIILSCFQHLFSFIFCHFRCIWYFMCSPS